MVPNCHADQSFTITIDFDDKANVSPEPLINIQSALLYTNSHGERRIRVFTLAVPTTPHINEIYKSVDVQASIKVLTNVTLGHVVRTTLSEGCRKLQQQCTHFVQQMNNFPQCGELQFLPLYVMGMLKSPAFRATSDLTADYRSYVWARLETLNVTQVASHYCARLLSLHNMEEHIGILNENGCISLPVALNLTSEVMTQDGVYLLEDGECMFMWIGRAVDTLFLMSVFGLSSVGEVDSNVSEDFFLTRNDILATKIHNIVKQIRTEHQTPFLQLHIVRQGDALENRFFASLIEDRTLGQSTYAEFLLRMGHRPQQQPTVHARLGSPQQQHFQQPRQ